MSAASVGPRDGDWSLLGHGSDPVPASEEGLDGVVAHYKKIAEAMATQAALLKKIGDGDETLLKGNSADAMRKRARENAGLLDKAGDRYENVRDALVRYQPELGTARSRTREALTEAENAAATKSTAEGTPDPVNEDRADDAPTLTEKDKQQSQKRAATITGANEAIEAAKVKAAAAMEALDNAAQTAANTIRKNWDVDGLHSSGWDKFLYGLNQFLKKLVEILGYIGLALTALAILIPGLGFLALAGIVVTVVATAATAFLAIQGEASWLGVIIGVLSLGLLGVGSIAGAALKGMQALKLTGGGWLKTAVGKVDHLKNLKNLNLTGGGKFQIPRKPVPGTGVGINKFYDRKIANAIIPINRWKDFAGATKINPSWWNVFSTSFWKADFATLKAFVPNLLKGKWDWRAALGPMDEIAAVRNIDGALKNILGAAPSGMGAWKHIGNIAGIAQPIFNMSTYIFSVTVAASNFNPGDIRLSWSKWLEAEFSDLYTKQLNL